MIARIKTKNGFYDSIVFALFKRNRKSSVVVFNQNYDALLLVKMWSSKRNVFIYNVEKGDGWIEKKQVEGYDWVLKNVSKKFFKTVINQDILDRCRALQTTVAECDWFEIKNSVDISGLMECAVSFHDSYLKDMYEHAQKQYILFDTTWGCEILLELEGNIETNLYKEFGRVPVGDEYPLIYDSSMFFENGLLYWIDDASIRSSLNLDKSKRHYFQAKNVKWKLIAL